VAMVRAAALVHDVGKVAIGEALLGRPDALARQDLEALRDHAVLGATIVEAVLAPEQARWVRHHHEHWDGNGYPDRLVGSAIPDGATIIAVADAWDAMTSDRPGVPARDPAEALHECIHGAGGRFAPGPVDALIQLWREGVLADWHRPALGDVYRPAA
ncbi:MAG: HD-GYP domain-containing protein, partial [Gaiellales bacterium]